MLGGGEAATPSPNPPPPRKGVTQNNEISRYSEKCKVKSEMMLSPHVPMTAVHRITVSHPRGAVQLAFPQFRTLQCGHQICVRHTNPSYSPG